MKTKKNQNFIEHLNHNDYSQQSLFASFLEADSEFLEDVSTYYKLKPNNSLISIMIDPCLFAYKSKVNDVIKYIEVRDWYDLQVNLGILTSKLSNFKKDIFKSVSLQRKDISKFMNENVYEMLNSGSNLDLGLESRFNNEDTVTMAESAEIVINKVQL
ncbi:hypothetical protein [Mycoplasma zalophidermidis]|uniref:Uncharacterized protein n=1 Tax=Mycoplasma zalophidermidis TaxID=398174 RepID=A0ABS6DQV9_9MOLU|nr:hypothetical protein [Mycoplasma zalophidermidis]MBU4689512.1 hypothetical protein [Mycoplasma zalophidermidis]MBU4693390.1 hypothetical protein [Mycoplasma zalophidermidis]MCR8966312.1 hypothetical protein [Mycoplasma zalophidermidis]